jgi:hypothetical protein
VVVLTDRTLVPGRVPRNLNAVLKGRTHGFLRLIALHEVRGAMHGTEPTKDYTFLYVKDMNMWGPHLPMHNRNIPALKRFEYCRLRRRIRKGGFFQMKNHDKNSTSCTLGKYILSFPRTWNAWTWSWHIPLKAQEQFNQQSGSQNTTPSPITFMWKH